MSKTVNVTYDSTCKITSVTENGIYLDGEVNSLIISASGFDVPTGYSVRAYIRHATSQTPEVTENITKDSNNKYNITVPQEFMTAGTLYIGYEIYVTSPTPTYTRTEPVKVYIDAFLTPSIRLNGDYTVKVEIGTVTTLPAGSDATVINEGTSRDVKLDFGIPKGDKGDTGEPGTTTYTDLTDKPSINGVTLSGNKSLAGLGIAGKFTNSAKNSEIFNDYTNNSIGSSYTYAHVEGYGNTASSSHTHIEGFGNTASGEYTHAEGYGNTVSATMSHVEGRGNTVSNSYAHVEGQGNTSTSNHQHVSGKYNDTTNNSDKAVIVGNGIKNGTDIVTSNAYTLDWSGNGWFAGDVTANKSGVSHKLSDKEDKSNRTGSIIDDSTKYPTSKAVYDSLSLKQNIVAGKGLSTNDYTTPEKKKVAKIGSVGTTKGSNEYQTVIGQYNDTNDTDLFIIGNGTDAENTDNALRVDSNNDLYVNGSINTEGDIDIAGDVEATNIKCSTIQCYDIPVCVLASDESEMSALAGMAVPYLVYYIGTTTSSYTNGVFYRTTGNGQWTSLGKELSSNDYTNIDKGKVDNLTFSGDDLSLPGNLSVSGDITTRIDDKISTGMISTSLGAIFVVATSDGDIDYIYKGSGHRYMVYYNGTTTANYTNGRFYLVVGNTVTEVDIASNKAEKLTYRSDLSGDLEVNKIYNFGSITSNSLTLALPKPTASDDNAKIVVTFTPDNGSTFNLSFLTGTGLSEPYNVPTSFVDGYYRLEFVAVYNGISEYVWICNEIHAAV